MNGIIIPRDLGERIERIAVRQGVNPLSWLLQEVEKAEARTTNLPPRTAEAEDAFVTLLIEQSDGPLA